MKHQPFSVSKTVGITLIVIALTILIYFVMGSQSFISDSSLESSPSLLASSTSSEETQVLSSQISTSSIASASTTLSAASAPATSIKITKVSYALLYEPVQEGDDKRMRGCDIIGFKEVRVPPTDAPLDASLKALFAKKEPWPPTPAGGNFLTSQKNLTFDRVMIENGEAIVYLKGSYTLSGICDDPRIALHVSETLYQFPEILSVRILVNEEELMVPLRRTQ